jgi:hypothetical protein
MACPHPDSLQMRQNHPRTSHRPAYGRAIQGVQCDNRECGRGSGGCRKRAEEEGVLREQVCVVCTAASMLTHLTPRRGSNSSRTTAMILFVDEIHRFSKSQQDIFLPWLENGQVQVVTSPVFMRE